jgi:3-carboxy-cis,cis-muconate cycloisomerase
MAAFFDRAYLQALLDVEVALAAAEAERGVIPSACVDDIRAVARAENFDLAELSADAARDGNVVIPLVRKLTAAVAERNLVSAHHVHRGATSQDIMDTALVLRLRDADSQIRGALARVMKAAAALARDHVHTPIAGRSWLQQASPTTFGLKAAGWLDMTGRCRQRLQDAVARSLVVQLGGASGTLAALADAGPGVTDALARQLDLGVPPMPWHTHRDRIVDVAAALGIACGALGKIGRDLTLLAQSEIGEATEHPAGGGGSSSMPHKQNPVRAVTAVSAAVRAPGLVATMLAAMPQEHERAAGAWQAEWQTMADLVAVTLESAGAIASALEELHVDTARMHDNLLMRGGVGLAEALSVALQSRVGRKEAMAHVERLCRDVERTGRSLREIATHDRDVSSLLTAAEIAHALTPENFLGAASVFIDRTLRQWEG